MNFGRKQQADSGDSELETGVPAGAEGLDIEHTDLADSHADAGVADVEQVAPQHEDQAEFETDEPETDQPGDDDSDADDEWAQLDASKDWRYDGPFDITEVDLSQDAELGIERVDLGSLVVTPEEDVAVQLQLQQETGQVQALLAMHENSGLEVALFAAPKESTMLPEVREGLTAASQEVGGSVEYAEGPFGTEIRRLLPIQGPDEQTYLHPSRIWLVQGPRWLLRGVLMGEAGMQDNLDGSAGVLLDFFRNIVVNRDTVARVPGDLVLLTLPPGVTIEEVPMEMQEQELPEA